MCMYIYRYTNTHISQNGKNNPERDPNDLFKKERVFKELKIVFSIAG